MVETVKLLDETLRYLGWKGQEIGEEPLTNIRNALEKCQRIAQPRHISGVYPVNAKKNTVELSGTGIHLQGTAVTSRLAEAKLVEVIAATLGIAVDREIDRYSRVNTAYALLLDAAATAIIEDYLDQTECLIGEKYKTENLAALPRFSPGYEDFRLEVQQSILSLLNAGKWIGLTCTNACVLIPRKSVTALVGICAPHNLAGKTGRPCGGCAIRNTCDFSICRFGNNSAE